MQEKKTPLVALFKERKGQLSYKKNTHSNGFYDLMWNVFTHLFPCG